MCKTCIVVEQMNKQQKIVFFVLAAISVIAAGAYLVYVKKQQAGSAGSNANPDSGAGGASTVVSDFPLKKGSRNMKVQDLQGRMNVWMLLNYDKLTSKPSSRVLTVDGIFGSKTLEFVQIIFKKNEVTETDFNNFNPVPA